MKLTVSAAGMIFLVATNVAQAYSQGIVHAQWCADTKQGTVQEQERIVKMPDGQDRGTRTASELYDHAVTAAKEGKDDEAILWLTHGCQHHNPEAAKSIRQERTSVLEYLKR